MAYTFLRGRHLPTGKSLVEDALVDTAANLEQEASAKGVNLVLPTDHLVTTTIQPGASSTLMDVDDERIANKIGVDIGPQTQTHFSETIRTAETVIWNGPMGVFEIDAFSKGTIAIAKAVAQSKGTTVIGGGDSVAAIQKAAVTEKISHVSTGGGASLEFLGGRILPGVAALPDC
jgi:phosphoglycerate kinase